MSNAITLSIRVPVETRRTAHGVIATCGFLDVCEAGASTDEAMHALTASLTSYFESCFEIGRFDELFRCNGFSTWTTDAPPPGGRFVDVCLKLRTPHKMLSKAEIAGGIRAALERRLN